MWEQRPHPPKSVEGCRLICLLRKKKESAWLKLAQLAAIRLLAVGNMGYISLSLSNVAVGICFWLAARQGRLDLSLDIVFKSTEALLEHVLFVIWPPPH